ncbi:E3 ubiquitin-protein ligase HEL2 [Rhodamnia argentea]|uniref:RING-type E3 ubiquitin transferase n=1 Tax=Rhodamnia argentea TaxID=178133 RepID=A0A8B8QZP1_9MYRT|nr:E3 ubiquitin-protein ligase HEL2 [Rhodamnia argentea]
MDDSCAVCAETLEWVAYGACGHREVCSTCVARLRFICDDRRCCICKTDNDVVLVTKALGDYTRMINDFSVLPSEPKEGRVGSYWFHEDTQAIFDDVDHYRMVKAMCKLSCSICDKSEEKTNDASKRRGRFRNIEQLKGHLFHQHKVLMCSLCLEGRKVFICEQKLYTRSQLNQHISTGDSEVDGSESERGGFAGHPMCEFCGTPFYGDNELYTHMSTEHYTCFICQRQHPGQYEYFKGYDDLEIHFRQEHFLCEDEACLAKKFIVFQSEGEMKRHNTLEHGGRMSRSKRNAALQIPTSFRYRRGNEQDRRRGRGRTFHRDFAEEQISMAIQASLETANVDRPRPDPSLLTNTHRITDPGDLDDIDQIVQPFESLNTTDSEPSARYLEALGQKSQSGPLQETAFPPLPMAASSSQQANKRDSEGLSNSTMAARLRRKSVRSPAQAWPAASRPSFPSTSSSAHTAKAPTMATPSTSHGPTSSSYASLAKGQSRATTAHAVMSAGSSKHTESSSTNKITHSSSAPNLVERASMEPSPSEFPPVSASHVRKMTPTSQVLPKVEDVHAANKSLVEKIRAAVDDDQEKFTVFKEISAHYRQGSIDTETYLDYVQNFGLSHLILDLARLCPDTKKQRELIETHNARMRKSGVGEGGWSRDIFLGNGDGNRKGKAKSAGAVVGNRKNKLADSIMSSVQEMQSKYKLSDEEVEVLSKDGYRSVNGKSKVVTDAEQKLSLSSSSKTKSEASAAAGGTNNNVGDGGGGGGSKQRKKTSKFHRVRLGEDSKAAILDLKNSDSDPDPVDNRSKGRGEPNGALPVRGVWKNGGGQKLFS